MTISRINSPFESISKLLNFGAWDLPARVIFSARWSYFICAGKQEERTKLTILLETRTLFCWPDPDWAKKSLNLAFFRAHIWSSYASSLRKTLYALYSQYCWRVLLIKWILPTLLIKLRVFWPRFYLNRKLPLSRAFIVFSETLWPLYTQDYW